MASVTLEIPDDLMARLKNGGRDAGQELRLAAAFSLCGQGTLSTSLAARLAGLSYAGFLEEAARRMVDLYHYDGNDINEELARPLPEGVDLEAIKQDIQRAQSRRG